MCVYACVLVTQLCLTLCNPHGLQPTWFLCPWSSPGKNTGVDCHSLLQRVFPTQGLNASPALQADSLPSEPPGKSKKPLPPNVGHELTTLRLRIYALSTELARYWQFHSKIFRQVLAILYFRYLLRSYIWGGWLL